MLASLTEDKNWTRFTMKVVLGVIVLGVIHASQASISFTTAPFNTTVGVGETATLACIVTGKTSESVKWKKLDNTALSVDSTVVADQRFKVVGTYNMTISGATRGDQGGYICEAGTISRTAYLTVVDKPTEVTIYWSNPPVPGTRANLTCKATHANPAPGFAWYKSEILQTTPAITYTTPSTSGYVDAYSVLPVRLTVQDQSATFRCQLEYTGLSRAMEAHIVTVLSNGVPVQTRNIVVIGLGMLLSLIHWQNIY